MEVVIPYNRGYERLEIKGHLDVEVLESRIQGLNPPMDEDSIVLNAMKNPVDSPALYELAQGKNSVTIICSDHTRPVPSKKIIPHMLKELRRANPQIKVTLLIATGFHRLTKPEELRDKFGDEIMAREHIVIHDCKDDSAFVNLGPLPSGAPLLINRHAVETDLLISEGFIEPHFFAGYSGGRKSVLPGVCARTTVLGNHCAAFIDSPYARTGILENNPIHRDMRAAAAMAGLQYIVNVVINGRKEVVGAFAGHPVSAHQQGCAYLDGLCRVSPGRPGDIVISSNGGYPLDQNIYQSVKSMTAAEAAAGEGAILIIASACSDGTGSDDFYHALKSCKSPESLLHEILTVPMDKTEPDQWETQVLARVLSKHRVILVCEPEIRALARDMKLDTAASVCEALQRALKEKGENASITIIPDGVSVVVKQV